MNAALARDCRSRSLWACWRSCTCRSATTSPGCTPRARICGSSACCSGCAGSTLARNRPGTGMRAVCVGFSFAGVLALYVLQRIQGVLPLGGDLGGVSPAVAFNTAVSFVTQYQLAVLRARDDDEQPDAGGRAHGAELRLRGGGPGGGGGVDPRAGAGARGGEIGNFWVDLTRGVLRVLLPLSFVVALFLLSQGVVQSFHSGFAATGLDGTQTTDRARPPRPRRRRSRNSAPTAAGLQHQLRASVREPHPALQRRGNHRSCWRFRSR